MVVMSNLVAIQEDGTANRLTENSRPLIESLGSTGGGGRDR